MSIKPKVLIIRSELLPISETFIKEQTGAYQKWDAIFVGRKFVKKGIELKENQCEMVPSFEPEKLRALIWKAARFCNLPVWGAAKLMQHQNARLAHVHFGTELVAWWPILKQLNIPVICTLHGYDINTYPEYWESKHGSWEQFYPKRLLKIAKMPNVHFVAVSNAIKNRAIQYGIEEKKITVQYIGVSVEDFVPDKTPITERAKKILYVGRMVEKKGGKYLIEAFKNVREKVSDAKLVMIGDGPLLQEYKDQASALDLDIDFLGALPANLVRQEIHKARVFCLPSVTASNGDAEGLGIVILEAQASGIPVVTSSDATLEAISNGVTGFHFEEKDVVTLTSHLINLLTNDALTLRMSEAAPTFIKDNLNLKKCSQQLEVYYDSVVKA